MEPQETNSLVGGLLSELRRAQQRHVLRELEKEFLYGANLRARLQAECDLHPIDKSSFKGKNFEQMYRGEMTVDQYLNVAIVLNLFRLLNSYKEAGDVDEGDARRAFGWIYAWWWTNVINPYSKGLEKDPDWAPHLTKHEWLLQKDC